MHIMAYNTDFQEVQTMATYNIVDGPQSVDQEKLDIKNIPNRWFSRAYAPGQ